MMGKEIQHISLKNEPLPYVGDIYKSLKPKLDLSKKMKRS